jgi:hypothetical protein
MSRTACAPKCSDVFKPEAWQRLDFKPEAWQQLAGGKRSATTGKVKKQLQHPGGGDSKG